jgi:hypothetical protein
MGNLSFEVVDLRLTTGTEVSLLGDATPGRVHGASLVARWRLSFTDNRPAATGFTLLALRRTGDGWAIVHDASM